MSTSSTASPIKPTFFVRNPSVLTAAFMQVFDVFSGHLTEVTTYHDADIVILCVENDFGELWQIYREDKTFWVLSRKPLPPGQPDNIFLINPLNIFGGGVDRYDLEIRRVVAAKVAAAKPAAPANPLLHRPAFLRKYHVLVIDDMKENRNLATTLLGEGHNLTVVKSLAVALVQIDQSKIPFDAVLSDMWMPVDNTFSPPLNLDQYGLAKQPYGFAALIEIGLVRKIPFAIVTDGNHHADWVTAMISHGLRSRTVQSTSGGTPIRFFHNIGKRWDFALKELMEPEC